MYMDFQQYLVYHQKIGNILVYTVLEWLLVKSVWCKSRYNRDCPGYRVDLKVSDTTHYFQLENLPNQEIVLRFQIVLF